MEEIEAIRERCEKATPGPWHPDKYPEYIWGPKAQMVGDFQAEDLLPGAVMRMRGVGAKLPIKENADFIAHARTDIPKLLAEIDRLKGELEKSELERKHLVGVVELLKIKRFKHVPAK